MSLSAIAGSGSSPLVNLQNNYQQVRNEFKQLGQDLEAGNLTQAQTDFVTLSQSVASQLAGNTPMAKALNTIGQALQSGNLAAAQQAFAALPISIVGPCAVPHHSHVGGMGAFEQTLGQLGDALQSGNLAAAQQAFAALQQVWQKTASAGQTGVPTGSLTSVVA
ncbi:MAG TPA: hypothetical protein VL240_00485 [Candidatus Binatia bacterium]|nr:hypothetical protein [Candidatus Binatia bacterium]